MKKDQIASLNKTQVFGGIKSGWVTMTFESPSITTTSGTTVHHIPVQAQGGAGFRTGLA
jgi:hypothetical protein